MSDVTFTPEQVREIRRRIDAAIPQSAWVIFGSAMAHARTAMLLAFPLPKVTRYRTFTMTWTDLGKVETYRVNDGTVEYRDSSDGWVRTNYGTGTVRSFASELAEKRRWEALAAFADVCARPTEEVDA